MKRTAVSAFSKAVGQRIEIARKARGMSRKALTAEIEYATHSMLSEIERGLLLPSHEKLVAIARVLAVSTDWIFGIDSEPCQGKVLESLQRKEAVIEEKSAQLQNIAMELKALRPLSQTLLAP